MPSATSIVARSYPDNVIGKDNALPWHLRTDLSLFRKRTVNHAVIMGRRTYDSLPRRPLPKRLNIVLSRDPIEETDNLKWARDIRTALLIADIYSICNMKKEFFVIGGETIYSQFEDVLNKVWLTQVFTGRINGDAKFEYEFDSADWWTPYEHEFQPSDGDDYPFRISCFIRRKPRHRQRFIEDFRGSDSGVIEMLDDWLAKFEEAPIEEEPTPEQLSLLP